MNKGTIGYSFILTGNVLHSFVFSVLLIEHWGTTIAYLYAAVLFVIIPNIIVYKKCKHTLTNTYANYFIVIGFIFTIGFIGLFYIVGGLLVNRYNNMTREDIRRQRVNV